MKRKYEVSFYEFGLTKRKTIRFSSELLAYLYKGWVEYKFKEIVQVEIKVINYD